MILFLSAVINSLDQPHVCHYLYIIRGNKQLLHKRMAQQRRIASSGQDPASSAPLLKWEQTLLWGQASAWSDCVVAEKITGLRGVARRPSTSSWKYYLLTVVVDSGTSYHPRTMSSSTPFINNPNTLFKLFLREQVIYHHVSQQTKRRHWKWS